MRRYTLLIILFLLSVIYHPSFAQNLDDDSLTSYIIKAAKKGDLKAQKYLVERYIQGDKGFKKNVEEAYVWAQILAENGDSDAQYFLASNQNIKPYVENKGKGQFFWLEQAALNSHPKALEEYGTYLFKKEEYNKAIPFLRKAAIDASSLYSLFLLAQISHLGLGVKVDMETAMQEYEAVTYLSETIESNDIDHTYKIPDFVFDAYKQMALYKAENKDFQSGLDYINKALNKNKWNKKTLQYVSLLDTRATIYLYAEQTNKCIEDWKRINNLYPDYIREVNTILTNVMTGNIDYLIPETNQAAHNTLAVIVANENYKRVPNVPHALNDGIILKKYLERTFGIPKDNIEYLEDASLNDIKYALGNVAQKCKAFKDQMSVIIYYAGHGVPDEKTNEAYLLPVDGFGTDPSSGINMEDFYEDLSQMPAKSVIVLLDACFSGAKRDGGMLMATRGITIKPNIKVPDGKLIVLSATSEDQTAFPIEEQKHGLFTYTLLRKIQETNGDITWGELADYVTETVKTRSIDLNGKLQTPTVSVSTSMKDIWRNIQLR